MSEELVHTPETLQKVYAGLMDAGLTETQAVNAVFQLQNRGILFRERADGDQRKDQPNDARERAGHS